MSVDYPGAIDMMLPEYYSFSSVAPLTIVNHKTGGDGTLQALYNTFYQTERSSHFGIDLQGRVAQFVPLNRGAGANCCADPAPYHNTFWDPYIRQYGNLNFCSISIEHCDPAANTTLMPPAQIDASNKLNLWLCNRFGITTDHIHSHKSIMNQSKPNCPGPTFDFDQLFSYINSQGINRMITPQMQAEADAVWNQTANDPPFNGTPPRKGTGIYTDWLRGYVNGHRFGSPTSQEYPLTDFNGNPMVAQNFGEATCYWRNDTPNWYDGRGLITF